MNSANFYQRDFHGGLWFSLAILVGIMISGLPALTVLGVGTALFLCVVSLQSPIATLIILMVLAPLRTLIATEAIWVLPLDIGQVLFLVLIGSYALGRIVMRQRLGDVLQFNWLSGALLMFLVATSIGVFIAWDMGSWLSEWLKWWVILVVMLISVKLGVGERWHWLIFGVVLGAFANALIGIYIFFGGSGADHLAIDGRFFRAFGTFGQPNPFGGFMGLVAPVAYASTFGWGWVVWRKWRSSSSWYLRDMSIVGFYAVMSLFISIGLVLSWSRGAWLSIAVAVGVMLFTLPRHWWQRLGLLLAGVILVGGAWAGGLVPASVTARLLSSTEELFTVNDVRGVDITSANYAVVERLAHWQAALTMGETHPWSGVGFGNYGVAYDSYRLINWREALGHAHNYYLNILAEAGIIGALAYVTMWAMIIGVTWSIMKHPDFMVRVTGSGLIGSWTYLLAHSLLDNLYVNNLFLHVGVLLGVVIILHQQTFQFVHRGKYVTD